MAHSTVSVSQDQFFVLTIAGTRRVVTDQLWSGGETVKGFTSRDRAEGWLRCNPQAYRMEIQTRSLTDYVEKGWTYITLDGYVADVREMTTALVAPGRLGSLPNNGVACFDDDPFADDPGVPDLMEDVPLLAGVTSPPNPLSSREGEHEGVMQPVLALTLPLRVPTPGPLSSRETSPPNPLFSRETSPPGPLSSREGEQEVAPQPPIMGEPDLELVREPVKDQYACSICQGYFCDCELMATVGRRAA